MIFIEKYKSLSKSDFTKGKFSIVPIRYCDRYEIMKWRNNQMYHLRQTKPLTRVEQDHYFDNIISKDFSQISPDQILFSFLLGKKCIGYGGLVHINWIDKNAEISFVINTEMQEDNFHNFWTNYLVLVEKVAFEELQFHKIFTYAFDLRPHLYEVLENSGFTEDARIKEHFLFDNKYLDVVIHSKINNRC